MAGHPTIGSTFALARSGAIGPDRKRMVFGLGIGPTPVSLTWKNDALTFAWMTQRMVAEAEAKGADAILAMRFDTSEIGRTWTEICAYGTAVKLAPKSRV